MLESTLKNLARQGAEHLVPAGEAASRRAEKTIGKKVSKPVVSTLGKDVLLSTAEKQAAIDAGLVSRIEKAVLKQASRNNKITFHVSPTESHEALLESIRTAKKSYYIETFIWHNDAAGNEVIQAFADRIKLARSKGEDFDAKVMIDWFGLRQGTGGTGDPEVVNKLKDAGVDVLEFSRGYLKDGKLIPLTHRKLHIKDAESFITGGRNLGDEYLKEHFTDPKGGQQNSWHDLMYTVQGDETARILEQFARNWKRAGGKDFVLPKSAAPIVAGSARVESFITDPLSKIYDLQKANLGIVANAQKELVVMYPYMSDDKLVQALREAKRANPSLSIKVLMPANKEVTAEGGIFTLLNKESARQMMADGIEVRMFAGGKVDGKEVSRFSHFKGMMADREVLSIGSANGDARTFRNNHELNTVIADKKTAADFYEQVVKPDWEAGVPLTQADLAKDGLWVRFKQRVLEALDFLL